MVQILVIKNQLNTKYQRTGIKKSKDLKDSHFDTFF
jgi:hypothetical protein